MNCKFDSNNCSLTCPKFSICSYFQIQTQLSEVQSQINTIYEAITKLVTKEKKNEENLEAVVALVNNYLQDSELKKNFNEESRHEKIN